MSAPLPATFSLSLPGRLCFGPTSATGAFPHGGTDLGDVDELSFVPGAQFEGVDDESLGGEHTQGVYLCEQAQFQVELSGMSAAMAAKVFAWSTSTKGGGYGKSGDDSRLMSTGEFVLYYSPLYPATQAGLILYRATAHWGDTARLRARAGTSAGVLIAFRGLRHATKGVYQIDLPADLVP